MNFKVGNDQDVFDDIPVAQTINISIPVAQPVIKILTWDTQLENFLKLGRMSLDPNFKKKLTDFSFENNWRECHPAKDCEMLEGSFTLSYKFVDIYVKIEGKYNCILTPKHLGVPTIEKNLTLSGSFDDNALLTWDGFRCDNCRDASHPLWFIKKINGGLCTSWWYIMKNS